MDFVKIDMQIASKVAVIEATMMVAVAGELVLAEAAAATVMTVTLVAFLSMQRLALLQRITFTHLFALQ